MKKVFLDDLPRYGKRISWKNSINQKVEFEYDDIIGVFQIMNYIKEEQELILKYNDINFNIKTSLLLRSGIGTMIKKISSDFKVEIGTEFKDNKRDLTIINTEKRIDKGGITRKYYMYICNKCKWNEGWIEESRLLGKRNGGCSCCNGKTVVQGINDIPTTAPWMVKYFQGGYDEANLYTRCSEKILMFKCPHCNRKKKTSMSKLYNRKSIGCNCSDTKSYISKYMFSLLEQLKEEHQINYFDTEIKFDWCNYYNTFKNKESYGLYDFIVEENKLIIETDGGWHREDNNISGQKLDESIWIDNMKDKLAEDNGYKVIRISDEGDIKENIINSELDKMFNLSNIDWIKCGEYACSNLVKEVCEYWKLHNEINNENTSTTDLRRIFKLDISTIIEYLKQGTKLKWCNYNPNSIQYKSKQVEIFKDETSLGKFESYHDLERQSEELFGVKLFYQNIALVCNGKYRQYKGFTFKYI